MASVLESYPVVLDTATINLESWELSEKSHRLRVAALSLLIWDYLLTFEDERRFFWNKPWCWSTYLFFWNRYNGLLIAVFGVVVLAVPEYTDSIRINLGDSWLRMEGWLGITSSWSVEIILQARIYILYERSKIVASIMGTAFAIQVVFIIFLLAFATRQGSVVPDTLGNHRRCKVIDMPDWIWLLWVALTTFELLLCCLAIYKGIQFYRASNQSGIAPFSSIQGIVLRDSIAYSLLIGAIYSMNLATWIKGMPDALDLITGMAIAFPCIMGARLMINTRAHTPAWLNSGFSPSQASITIPRMAPPDGATGTIAGDAESGDGYDEYRLPIRSNSLRVPTDGLEEGNSGRMARTHVLQLQRSSSRGRYASGPDWHVLDTFCTNSNADGDAESIPAR